MKLAVRTEFHLEIHHPSFPTKLMAILWNFIKTPKGGVIREASDDNYFRYDSADMVESLVRENIQNALDAKAGAKAVKVRFGINTVPKNKVDFIRDLLSKRDCSVIQHYRKACEDSEIEPQKPDFKQPTFLLIEDFETKGLDGDVKSPDKGGFAIFWRNAGVTNKGKGRNRGGSFGIGKIVNPMSSKIQTFFGLTVRNLTKTGDKDAGPLLMGQTMLSIHTLGGTRYEPYALFGDLRSGLELPVKDERFIRNFTEAVGFTRKNEPGLSLAVPFPIEDFTPDSIAEAVIRHYFYPIVRKHLVVEISEDTSEIQRIDHSNIEALASDIGEEIAQIIAFTKRAQSKLDSDPDLKAKEYEMRHYGEHLAAHHFDSALLASQKLAFQDGGLIKVDIPIHTQLKNSRETRLSSVKLFLEKTEGRGMDYYIRNGISLHENSCFAPSTPCVALLLSDDGEIAELLRKAEGPAHTQWVQRNCKAVSIYENATKVIGYVKSLLERMQNLLGSGLERDDESMLADDFPDSGLEVESNPQVTQLSLDTKGTLTIKSTDEAAKEAGKVCTVKMWFESAMRGPKWRPYDFNLRQMEVAANGTTLLTRDKNVIQFRLTPEFAITVKGFNRNKDLATSVKVEQA